MSTNDDLLIIWILTASLNLAAIAVVVLLTIRSKQYADMDFPRYLPLGPKTFRMRSKDMEAKKCSE